MADPDVAYCHVNHCKSPPARLPRCPDPRNQRWAGCRAQGRMTAAVMERAGRRVAR
jgi:hypothetical protein